MRFGVPLDSWPTGPLRDWEESLLVAGEPDGRQMAPCDRQAANDRIPQIVMVIDHLEPGGAQRQFCLLATSLRRRGFNVTVVVFRPDLFFEDALQDVDIPIVYLRSRNRLHLWFLVRQEIRRGGADVVISFLSWSNLIVELAGLPTRRFSMIVSERTLDVTIGVKRRIAYHCHRLADVVVSNSYTQGEIVARILRRWKIRTTVIVNGIDIRHFKPAEAPRRGGDGLRLLVVGRFSPEKNALRFIEAVSVVCARHPAIGLEVDWYGKAPADDPNDDAAWAVAQRDSLAAHYRRVVEKIDRCRLQRQFRVHAPQRDVRELYLRSDVVCMPSLYEGCSNVIAEAMACAIPVLASRVGDNVRLVEDGRNGLLFDPMSVDDMVKAIVGFAELPDAARRMLGREGRKMAKELLSVETFTDRYVKLIGEVSRERFRA